VFLYEPFVDHWSDVLCDVSLFDSDGISDSQLAYLFGYTIKGPRGRVVCQVN